MIKAAGYDECVRHRKGFQDLLLLAINMPKNYAQKC